MLSVMLNISINRDKQRRNFDVDWVLGKFLQPLLEIYCMSFAERGVIGDE
jgi:hypothetical protein